MCSTAPDDVHSLCAAAVPVFLLLFAVLAAGQLLSPPALVNLNRFLSAIGCDANLCASVMACGTNLVCENGEVTRFVLRDVPAVAGTIGPELAGLSQLTHLFIANTSISGSLHPTIGALSKIVTFVTAQNRLTGPICSEFGLLTKLRAVSLNGNSFSLLPSEVARLSALVSLHVQQNKISGTYPTELNRLTGLQFLRVDDNLLTGPLPVVSQMQGLVQFLAYKNAFSGAFTGVAAGAPTNKSWCYVQADTPSERNCIDCGANTVCSCDKPPRTCVLATTGPTTPSSQTSMMSISATLAVPSTTTSTASTTTSTATTAERMTTVAIVSAPMASSVDATLIGGIVGGAVAAVLIGVGVVVALVMRRRRQQAAAVVGEAPSGPRPVDAPKSVYAAFPTPQTQASEYEVGNI